MAINWDSIIMGAVSASLNGVSMFIVIRYTSRLFDKIEKKKDK